MVVSLSQSNLPLKLVGLNVVITGNGLTGVLGTRFGKEKIMDGIDYRVK